MLTICLCQVSAQSWRGFWANHWNKFDFVVVVWSLASTALLLAYPAWLADTIHPIVSDLLELSRGVRVLRIISVFPRLRSFVGTLGTCTLLALQLGVLYVAVTYSFAVVGMYAFAVRCYRGTAVHSGEDTRSHCAPQHVNPDSFQCQCSPQDYSFANFNHAMLALFQITVGYVASAPLCAVIVALTPFHALLLPAITGIPSPTPTWTRYRAVAGGHGTSLCTTRTFAGRPEGGFTTEFHSLDGHSCFRFCTTLMANILTGLIIDAFDIAKVCYVPVAARTMAANAVMFVGSDRKTAWPHQTIFQTSCGRHLPVAAPIVSVRVGAKR